MAKKLCSFQREREISIFGCGICKVERRVSLPRPRNTRFGRKCLPTAPGSPLQKKLAQTTRIQSTKFFLVTELPKGYVRIAPGPITGHRMENGFSTALLRTQQA